MASAANISPSLASNGASLFNRPISTHCQKLQHPDALTTALASIILVGILISYLPQHYKIASRRSSEGLSPWWVLLGGLSSIGAIGCILVLPSSRSDMGCCREISAGACVGALLGIAQIGLQWACFMFIVFLFLIFFPADPSSTSTMEASTPSLTATNVSAPPKRRDALIVGVATLLTLLVVSIASLAIVSAYPKHTQNWANVLGTFAGVLSAIQYLPQIYYTWRLRDVKSLSIATMIIQVPGAFLFAFSLWLRVGWEGWGTWVVYVITGVLQSILLALAIWFNYSVGDKTRTVGWDGTVEYGQDDLEDEGAVSGGAAVVPDESSRLISRNNTISRDRKNKSYGSTKSQPQRVNTSQSQSHGGEDGGDNTQVGQRTSSRNLSLLYNHTPPDQDSDPEEDEGEEQQRLWQNNGSRRGSSRWRRK